MDSFADTEVTRSWTQWRIALGRSYRFVYNGGQELSVVCRGPRSHPRLERRPFSREIVDLSIDCNSQLTGEDAPFDGDIDIHDFHALPINPQLAFTSLATVTHWIVLIFSPAIVETREFVAWNTFVIWSTTISVAVAGPCDESRTRFPTRMTVWGLLIVEQETCFLLLGW